MAFQNAFLPLLLLVAIVLMGCDGELSSVKNDAIDQKNPALCDKLKSENERSTCYQDVAEGLRDPKACLGSNSSVDCVAHYAARSNRISSCDVLPDQASRYLCVAAVTGDQTGRAIEQMIGDWNTKGAIGKCVELCKSDGYKCRIGCGDSYAQGYKECEDKCNWDQWDCEDRCKA